MRRVSFEVAEEEVDDLLDRFIWMLPNGLRQENPENGRVRLEAAGVESQMPTREQLEDMVGRELAGYREETVPADWFARRQSLGRLVGGKVLLRGPHDDPAPDGVIDLVIDWDGKGFGVGSHPTTRLCMQLIMRLEPQGAFVDVGCGVGTLAILAGKLGFDPVLGVDHYEPAIESSRRNAELNDAKAEFRVLDAIKEPVPIAPTMAVNVPPNIHECVVAALDDSVQTLIVSGIAGPEVEPVVQAYADAGLHAVWRGTDADDFWSALLLQRGASRG